MKKLFTLLASFSEKRPWLVVISCGLLTLFLFAGMGLLKTEFSQEGMMPSKYESVRALKTLQNEFGGLSYENILIEGDDVTGSRIAGKIIGLTPEALVEGGVKEGDVLKVETYLDGLKMMSESQGMPVPSGFVLGAAIQQYLATPYAQAQILGKSLTEDRKATLVKLQLNPKMSENEQIELANSLDKYFKGRFANSGERVYISGMASMQRDAQEMMARQTSILFLVALIYIMLILYVTFRRVSDVFLLLFVIIIGIFWLLGLMGWVGITYTTMSVAIMPLMLGINIAYVIHILSRYYEEREAGGDIFYSSTTAVKTVGVAVFLTAITTVFGFSSFTITDIPPMRDFGIVCMIGIVFSFILSITLLPAVIVLRDRRKSEEKLGKHLEKMRTRRRDSRYGAMVDRGLVRASMTAYHHHWIVAVCVVVLIGLAVFSMFNLQTGADVRGMMGSDLPSVKASEEIAKYFGAQEFDVILVKGDPLDPKNLEALMELEESIPADKRNQPDKKGYFSAEGIVSIANIIADSNGGSLPRSREEVGAILGELSKQMDLSSMVSKDGDYTMVMVKSETPETQNDTNTKSQILKDAADRMESETQLQGSATGFSVLIADLMGTLIPNQLKTSGLALVLCLLVLIVVFKSLSYGLVTLIVVVCGMCAEIVFLFALGWALDMMTVTVASLVIGAGVDFGIHVTHRFREQHLENGLPLEDSVKTTVLHVGRALVAGGLTTAGVFGILGISSMEAMRHFGWTTAAGLLAALVGAIFVLPSLLVIISRMTEKLKAGKAGKSVEEPAPRT
ncbi:MAG: MMPL family transporter [Actinobacteria bacterium]|nr:MMPL family transporter [Actinomycetota bacterium]MBU2688547.1 MMPL family transporter [Actinomycetota bacterium]